MGLVCDNLWFAIPASGVCRFFFHAQEVKVTQYPLNFACFEEDMPSLNFGQGDDEWEGLDSEE